MGLPKAQNLEFKLAGLKHTAQWYKQVFTRQALISLSVSPLLYYFVQPVKVNGWCHVYFLLLQEWIYYLNEGSQINISYSVRPASSFPLSLVIAEGKSVLMRNLYFGVTLYGIVLGCSFAFGLWKVIYLYVLMIQVINFSIIFWLLSFLVYKRNWSCHVYDIWPCTMRDY